MTKNVTKTLPVHVNISSLLNIHHKNAPVAYMKINNILLKLHDLIVKIYTVC